MGMYISNSCPAGAARCGGCGTPASPLPGPQSWASIPQPVSLGLRLPEGDASVLPCCPASRCSSLPAHGTVGGWVFSRSRLALSLRRATHFDNDTAAQRRSLAASPALPPWRSRPIFLTAWLPAAPLSHHL